AGPDSTSGPPSAGTPPADAAARAGTRERRLPCGTPHTRSRCATAGIRKILRAGSLHWAALIFFAVPAVGADPIPKPPTVPPTAWEIYEILHTSCVECHGGHLAKPKGKLG